MQQHQPAAASHAVSMGMAAAWLLHGHAAWAWLLYGHAAASKPGCMQHGAWHAAASKPGCMHDGAWHVARAAARARMFESSKFAAV
jgi:hypothetical protein